MTYHLIGVVSTEKAARSLRFTIVRETNIPEEVIHLVPASEGRTALWIDTPRNIAKDKIRLADAIQTGFYHGYERGFVDGGVEASIGSL